MTPDALNRAARQIALPQIGLDGQRRIAAATVVIVGDDVTSEVAARALVAGGVGVLRWLRRSGPVPASVMAALVGSNPDVRVDALDWSAAGDSDRTDDGRAGPDTKLPWLDALRGGSVVVRSGFDDDPMLRAAVRLGIPVVVARGRVDRVDVVSFRRHGPCPHAALDVPEQAADGADAREGDGSGGGAGAVVAAHVAAAEALAILAGATTGAGRARHVFVPLAAPTGSSGDALPDGPRATDIPWAPECFACGGAATELSLS